MEKRRYRDREKQGYLQIVNMREDNLIIFENNGSALFRHSSQNENLENIKL